MRFEFLMKVIVALIFNGVPETLKGCRVNDRTSLFSLLSAPEFGHVRLSRQVGYVKSYFLLELERSRKLIILFYKLLGVRCQRFCTAVNK